MCCGALVVLLGSRLVVCGVVGGRSGVLRVVILVWFGVGVGGWRSKNGGPKIVKNGPRVWAFCKIEFPGIQKPVHIFG